MRVSPFSMSLALTAAVTIGTGCARPWPSVRVVADEQFLDQGGIRTVDVLPVDVGVFTGPTIGENPDAVADRFYVGTLAEIQRGLAVRGYVLNAVIGPEGSYRRPDGQVAAAMTAKEIEGTSAALAAFGSAQSLTKDVILTPYLPSRLGTVTGADATLYVGGWAYAGKDESGIDAGDVAKVVIIGLFIIVIVAVAIVVARKGGGGGLGGGASSAGRGAASSGASAAGSVLRGAGHAAGRGLTTLGRGTINVLRGFRGVDDAWGRPSNQLNVYLNVPVGPPPPEQGPSRTNLEMTLVDNHRGVVLWHTRQVFPASPARPGDVRDVIGSLLSGLPMSQ